MHGRRLESTTWTRERTLGIVLMLGAVACGGGAGQGAKDPTAAPPTKDPPAAKAPDDPKAEPLADTVTITYDTADGVTVTADVYWTAANDVSKPVILAFHQARWNAGEYADIAPRLVELGFNVVAPDARSGGDRDGRVNRTVSALGKSTDYFAALPDLEATLKWAEDKGFPKIVVWGSSYSAALVFELAADHPEVHAVLAFSPGEYIEGQSVEKWAAGVSQPIYATSAPGKEAEVTRTLLAACKSKDTIQLVPKHGVHGSSTLKSSKNPKGADENWAAVENFLERVGR